MNFPVEKCEIVNVREAAQKNKDMIKTMHVRVNSGNNSSPFKQSTQRFYSYWHGSPNVGNISMNIFKSN